MVKNGQKLTKRSVFPYKKKIILEMPPIGMIQETQKKTEISDVVGSIVKKRHFFDVFFFLKNLQITKQKHDNEKKDYKNVAFSVFLGK